MSISNGAIDLTPKPQRTSLRGGQVDAELWKHAFDVSHTNVIAVVGAQGGCLAGDTEVHVNRAGKGGRMSIAHVARQLAGTATCRSNGGGTMPAPRWDPRIPTYVARETDGVVTLALLRSAWCSGIKATSRLVTTSGRSIVATDDHRFLTRDGWATLGDLSVGDRVRVSTGRSRNGPMRKARYQHLCTHFHPHQVDHGRHAGQKVPTHRLMVEAEMNDLTLPAYLTILRRDPERSAMLRFLPRSMHVHHINEDSRDNRLTNLAVMEPADHLRGHAKVTYRHVLWQVEEESIASITPSGDRETYDLAVEDEPHNFVANDFVVHNSGKTRITFALGSAVAQLLGLNVIAVDLDDDYGALLDLVPTETRSGYSLEQIDDPRVPVPLPRLRPALSLTPSRMLVMRGPDTEMDSEDLDEMLARLGSVDVVIFDCAAGLGKRHPRAQWAMRRADQVIVVARSERSGASTSAEATDRALREIDAPGVLVLNRRRRWGRTQAQDAFVNVSGLAGTVHVPESRRLARLMEAQRYRLEDVEPSARRAIRELTTVVGERLR